MRPIGTQKHTHIHLSMNKQKPHENRYAATTASQQTRIEGATAACS